MLHLVYLVVDDLAPKPAECDRIRHAIEAVAPGRLRVTVAPIEIGLGHYYESHVALAMTAPGVLHQVLAHQDASAIILGCFGDPMLRAAQEASSVPVIGAGEASMILARFYGRRFGIVHIRDTNIDPCEDEIASLGLEDRCVGMTAIEADFSTLLDDPADTLDRLTTHGGILVDRGAQVLILGCLSLGLGPFAEDLSARLRVPVINPVAAAVAAAHTHVLLGMRRHGRPLGQPQHLGEYLPAVAAASTAAGLRGWTSRTEPTLTEDCR